ncbi:MAG: carboxypeptidase-like regulatory domain-containing protein, partial [Planctomycetaceae bacterium]|nr:carboxypeptidase-like regulatory domain-containing protein [Planctomycetaceae bacterium]
MRHLLILSSGLFLMLLISGCGSGQVKGAGTVKYDTGEPVPFGMVIFSTDTNQYTGEIKDGVFSLGGIRPGDGLPPGNYQVT